MNILIIFVAKYLIFVTILFFAVFSLFMLVGERKRKIQFIFTCFSFPISFVVAKIGSFFINDPRPFVVAHFKPLITHAADNGFPSDHMLLAMVIASVVFIYNKKLGLVLIVLACLIGIARVLAGVHHPLDVIGSTAISTTVTLLINKQLKFIDPHINKLKE